jgi:poly-gamma-glutamate synthase PgsB/CapB
LTAVDLHPGPGGSLLGQGAVVAVLLYLAFLLAENLLMAWARARLRIVVHVNGTRGKTETTRLLAAVFRAAGLRTLAKTTGTEPCLILADGQERRIRRFGAANVREQRNVLLRAAFGGVDALVVECMAVSPEAQAASTAFLRPSILVVTNARPDHTAEQGSPEQALAVFAEGIPPGGLVVTADPDILDRLAQAADARGARAILAAPLAGTAARIPENAGVALAIARSQGIAADLAMAAMRAFQADCGAFSLRRLAREGGAIHIVDALAANDPVSTAQLFRLAETWTLGPGPRLLLFADRGDRADRTWAFASWIATQGDRFEALLVAGQVAPRVRRLLEAAFPGTDPHGRPRVRPLARIADLALEPPGTVIFAGGNWKGHGPALAALAPALATPERWREA